MTFFHLGARLMRFPLLLIVALSPLCGQETQPSELREKVDDLLSEGRERVAFGTLAAAIESATAPAEALELFSDVAGNVGEYDRADAAAARWLKEHPDDARARMHRARQLWRKGDHDAALALLEPLLKEGDETEGAPKWNFPAIALAGEIHADRGEDDAAKEYFDDLVAESQRIVLRDPKDLFALSSAVAFFGGKMGLKQAEKDLIEAQKKKLGPEVDVALGWLYLNRMYIWADAAEEFKAALKKRPAYVPALVGLHAAYAAGQKRDELKTVIDQILGINPSQPDALAVLAREDLEGFELAKAGEKIERGLRVAPAHKELRSLRATRKLLEGDKAGFEKEIEELLKLDPTYGECFRTVADVLNQRRRWAEARDLMARAVKVDPKDPLLYDDLARYELYLGRNAVAQETLKTADDLDVFIHPWRKNIGILLRWIAQRYKTVDTDKFAVRMFDDNVPALSKIALPFFERSYALLTAKYKFTPQGVDAERSRMLIEVFKDHKDFSVRTFGFNGLGALGVCFGPFIAMDAPNAMDPGAFSWARTFHHELAHTMTLGLSKGRVPRWLTEGLSTFEEAELEPSWTRGMDRELFDAYHTGDLLKVLDFDPAFMTPRIIFAYYQGGLEAGFLVKAYGMDRMIEALKLFGEDLPHEEVFKRAFGVTPQAVDEAFAKFVADRIAPMKMQPRYRADIRERMEEEWKTKPTDELLVKLAWARWQAGKLADAEALLAEAVKRKLADPRLALLEARLAQKMNRTDRAKELLAQLEKSDLKDFDLAFDLAGAAERRGDVDEAMTRYREAIDCFPTNPDKKGPRVQLAKLLRGGGKTDEAVALLEEHLRNSAEDLASRKAVIEAKRAAGDQKAALAHLEQYVYVQPLEADIHLLKAEILLGQSRAEDSLVAAECGIEVAATPVTKASACVAAAKALIKLGKNAEARARVNDALQAAPQHAGAKALLAELDSISSGERK